MKYLLQKSGGHGGQIPFRGLVRDDAGGGSTICGGIGNKNLARRIFRCCQLGTLKTVTFFVIAITDIRNSIVDAQKCILRKKSDLNHIHDYRYATPKADVPLLILQASTAFLLDCWDDSFLLEYLNTSLFMLYFKIIFESSSQCI